MLAALLLDQFMLLFHQHDLLHLVQLLFLFAHHGQWGTVGFFESGELEFLNDLFLLTVIFPVF